MLASQIRHCCLQSFWNSATCKRARLKHLMFCGIIWLFDEKAGKGTSSKLGRIVIAPNKDDVIHSCANKFNGDQFSMQSSKVKHTKRPLHTEIQSNKCSMPSRLSNLKTIQPITRQPKNVYEKRLLAHERLRTKTVEPIASVTSLNLSMVDTKRCIFRADKSLIFDCL